MNKIKLVLWTTLLLALMFSSCREEFDDHYHKVGDASIGMSVTQVLEEKGDFTLFLKMIQRANLEKTLSESGLYTCLAPRDKDVQTYLDENSWTIETMPMQTLISYINYHFIVNTYYYYDLEKRYDKFDNSEEYNIKYCLQPTVPTRSNGDDLNPSKFIRIFTQSYLDAREEDYRYLRGERKGDFMVEGVPVSATDRDIPTSNGVIHVLDGPLPLAPRVDEALAQDPDLGILNKWLDRFYNYESKGINDKTGNIDTIKIKYYNISTSTSGKNLNLANETSNFIFLAPTDQGIKQKLDRYITPELLVSYDSIPAKMMVAILQGLICPVYSESGKYKCWGLSDISRNYPYFFAASGAILPIANDIAGMYKSSLLSSNAVIYKLDELPELPILQSVEAGLYIYHKKYGEWQKMLENGKLNPSVTDNSSYQHPPKTILIQPDSERDAWINPKNGKFGVNAYEDKELDTLSMRLRSGILDIKITTADEFEHRFYPGPFGYILYEDGYFYDYKGKAKEDPSDPVKLLSDAVWQGENGSIFEIDGIFEKLDRNDTNQLMYRTYLKDNPEFSTFNSLLEKANLLKLLDTKDQLFTVFAPTNEAFQSSGYSQSRLESMDEKEATKLVYYHIVRDSRIFTDGIVQTGNTMSGLSISTRGAWENFQVVTSRGKAAAVKDDQSNMQASNGVIHGITRVLDEQ